MEGGEEIMTTTGTKQKSRKSKYISSPQDFNDDNPSLSITNQLKVGLVQNSLKQCDSFLNDEFIIFSYSNENSLHHSIRKFNRVRHELISFDSALVINLYLNFFNIMHDGLQYLHCDLSGTTVQDIRSKKKISFKIE